MISPPSYYFGVVVSVVAVFCLCWWSLVCTIPGAVVGHMVSYYIQCRLQSGVHFHDLMNVQSHGIIHVYACGCKLYYVQHFFL